MFYVGHGTIDWNASCTLHLHLVPIMYPINLAHAIHVLIA